jgi:hypothetical protein
LIYYLTNDLKNFAFGDRQVHTNRPRRQ